jgi:hypothetical protein
LFLMYQGALTMPLSTLFWNRCIMSILLCLVQPQSWIPYVQAGFVLQSNGNNNGKVNYKSEPLKLDVTATVPPPSPTTAPPPVTPATTSTPLSTRPRYPKEDPTLEYGAYDNPALTPSPVFENNQPETTPVCRRQESSFWTDCKEGNMGTWTQEFCAIKQPWAQGVSLYEEIPESLKIRGEGISERQKNLRKRDSWIRIVLRFRNCLSTTEPRPIPRFRNCHSTMDSWPSGTFRP